MMAWVRSDDLLISDIRIVKLNWIRSVRWSSCVCVGGWAVGFGLSDDLFISDTRIVKLNWIRSIRWSSCVCVGGWAGIWISAFAGGG
jgi:hypothetical protein